MTLLGWTILTIHQYQTCYFSLFYPRIADIFPGVVRHQWRDLLLKSSIGCGSCSPWIALLFPHAGQRWSPNIWMGISTFNKKELVDMGVSTNGGIYTPSHHPLLGFSLTKTHRTFMTMEITRWRCKKNGARQAPVVIFSDVSRSYGRHELPCGRTSCECSDVEN